MMKRKNIVLLAILIFLAGSSLFIWHFYSFRNHCAIPIGFFPYMDTVYTTAEIQGHKYCLQFDLGMSFLCELKKEILEHLNKQYVGMSSSVDLKGNNYESPVYSIPKVKIGRALYFNMSTRVADEKFLLSDIFPPKKQIGEEEKAEEEKKECDEKIVGILGLGLFLRTNTPALFLDLNNASVFMIKNIHRFHEVEYSIEKMIKIPLEIGDKCLLTIEVETDFGKRKFLLDTGTTINLIRPSFVLDKNESPRSERAIYTSSKFKIGETDLGSENFCLFNMSPACGDIDGVLGMSFFRKYAIFLDFQNHVAYIGPSQTKNTRR